MFQATHANSTKTIFGMRHLQDETKDIRCDSHPKHEEADNSPGSRVASRDLSPDQEFCFEIGGSGHQHVQSGAVE
jgi:hypothetical protein